MMSLEGSFFVWISYSENCLICGYATLKLIVDFVSRRQCSNCFKKKTFYTSDLYITMIYNVHHDVHDTKSSLL